MHKGKDLKGSYSDSGKTLFSTLRETLNSASQSVSVTPTKPYSREVKSERTPVVSVVVEEKPKA